jgi:hypothetical protein
VSKICGREREERERKKGKEKENELLRRRGALRKKKKERGRRGEERGVEWSKIERLMPAASSQQQSSY